MRAAWLLLLAGACVPGSDDDPFAADLVGGGAVFDVGGGFWHAPFPSDHRVREDSRRVDVGRFPNPDAVPWVEQLLGMLDDATQGWSMSGALYLPLDRAVDVSRLPDLAASTGQDALVYLVDVDRDGGAAGARHPVDVAYREADGMGPTQAIVARPVSGLPLAPRRRYALVVDRELYDADGGRLVPPRALRTLVAGDRPEGWRADVADQYADALAVLAEQDVDVDRIAGLSVFTTGRPTRDLDMLLEAMEAGGGLRTVRTPRFLEVHDDFCVFEGTFEVPVLQAGEPPYRIEGGGIELGEDGVPLIQGQARGRLFVTIPRRGPIPNRWPTVVFARTGGGGDRPLIDRGPRSVPGEDVPGTGYAALFARAGWAAVQLDGPLGGPVRNPDGGDEQALVLNLANPVALRDTLRQSALELALVPQLLQRIFVQPELCPGLPVDELTPPYTYFDTENLVLFGHAVGATIGPVAAALQPAYRGLVLSGAGGSWIENVLHKQSPSALAPMAATMLREREVDAFHPALTLLQWAVEPADAPLVAPRLFPSDDPARWPHVLMLQGVEDSAVPPPVANALSLGFGLEQAGPSLDAQRQPQHRSLASLLPYTGGRVLRLPAGLNRSSGPERNVTGLVVQHLEDGIEDGHEVAYQRAEARHQVRCFLEGMVTDAPLVPIGLADADAPCPPSPGR